MNWLSSNHPMEDAYSLHSTPSGAVIIGVYDGHGGRECGDIVSRYLPHYIDYHVQERLKGAGRRQRKDVITRGIKSAFVALDQDLLKGMSITINIC